MSRWAIVAIPLMFCLVLAEAVARQFLADRAFARAKDRIEEFERDYVLFLKGKKERPEPITSLGAALKKAVKFQPTCAEYRVYLGRYYQALAADSSISDSRRLALARQAMKEYREAVRLDPLNGVYYAYMAYLQGVMGQHREAVANFEEAVKLNRSNKWIQQMFDAYREWTTSPAEAPQRPGGLEAFPSQGSES